MSPIAQRDTLVYVLFGAMAVIWLLVIAAVAGWL